MAAVYDGLRIMDVKESDNPVEIAFMNDLNFVSELIYANEYVYVLSQESEWSSDSRELIEFNVHNPKYPELIAKYSSFNEIPWIYPCLQISSPNQRISAYIRSIPVPVIIFSLVDLPHFDKLQFSV